MLPEVITGGESNARRPRTVQQHRYPGADRKRGSGCDQPSDAIVAELERRWPKWQVWYVPRVVGGIVWCARRCDDERHVLNAGSPKLTEYLEAETAG
jgi:hypothetical protein